MTVSLGMLAATLPLQPLLLLWGWRGLVRAGFAVLSVCSGLAYGLFLTAPRFRVDNAPSST